MRDAAADALKALYRLPESLSVEEVEAYFGDNIKDVFKRHFSNIIGDYYTDIWEKVERLKKEIDENEFDDVLECDADRLRDKVIDLIKKVSWALMTRKLNCLLH